MAETLTLDGQIFPLVAILECDDDTRRIYQDDMGTIYWMSTLYGGPDYAGAGATLRSVHPEGYRLTWFKGQHVLTLEETRRGAVHRGIDLQGLPDPDGPDFGVQLAAWRGQHRLTQDEAARFLSVPVDTLRRWEQGRQSPAGRAPGAKTSKSTHLGRIKALREMA